MRLEEWQIANALTDETVGAPDVAFRSVTRSRDQQHKTMVLAGLSTFGTEAAAEMVCRPELVSELLGRLPADLRKNPFFEAIIDVHVSSGVPVQSKIVALRVLKRP